MKKNIQKELFIGSIVYSKSGRDAGKCYIIVKLDVQGYVYVANGVEKTLASPKRKNIKHLDPTGEVNETIAEKIIAGKQVFDSEIKSALRVHLDK